MLGYHDKLCSVKQCLPNSFAIDRTIISLFDIESQVFVTVETMASL